LATYDHLTGSNIWAESEPYKKIVTISEAVILILKLVFIVYNKNLCFN
jgi:hypothetical protein